MRAQKEEADIVLFHQFSSGADGWNGAGGGWGGGLGLEKEMSVYLDFSALHFPGNRWKQRIKTPQSDPGHTLAQLGLGGAGGHLFHVLNRARCMPSPW